MSWLLGTELAPGGELVFTSSQLVIGLAVTAAILAFALALRAARRVPGAGPETALFVLGLLPLLFAAAGPVWVQEAGRRIEGRVVVLVDDSRSMSVLEDGAPRSASVPAALARVGSTAERFVFGAELTASDNPSYQQGSSDLGAALQAVSDRYAGEKLAGVVVITDGIDRGGLRRRLMAGGELAPLPGPLTIYQVGDRAEMQDLAVAEVKSGGYAFIHAEFTVKAEIQAAGYADLTVPVALESEGQVISTRDVTLDENGHAEAVFTLKRAKPGRVVYEVSVPVLSGDAVPGNNRMPLAVEVVRDRVRVLQVCGSPGFDEKFLRLFLKEDPSVDLVSFFILRTPEDLRSPYHPDELSLIKFPYEDLFSTELGTFDLIIFQNFDYASFFEKRSDELLGNVAEHVKKGAAFVMLGGDRSFDAGKYGDTPLSDILPVQLGMNPPAIDEAAFTPRLTAAGKAHPVSRLVGNPADNEGMWAALPPLDGLNRSKGAAPGAAVLLDHPQTGEPVLAVREVGKGRSMALMGDSSWRWVMTEAQAGRGNQAYLRFWKNAMRWLVNDPDGQRVRVESTRENYVLGDTIRIVGAVRDVSYAGVKGVTLRGTITGPDGTSGFEAQTDAHGEAVFELPATARGTWTVDVRAEGIGEDRTAFAVTARDPELEEVGSDEAFLAALAAASGGVHYEPGDYGAPKLDPDSGRELNERTEIPLASAPALALVAGVALSLSWWLRRRRGLR